MTEPYLLDHPHDYGAYLFWVKADDMAEKLALDEKFGSGILPISTSDPGFKARAQHRAEFDKKIRRRQMMPPWQAERLRRAERGVSDR